MADSEKILLSQKTKVAQEARPISRVIHEEGGVQRVLRDERNRLKAKRDAKQQFAGALTFGIGTSAFAAAPIFEGGESISSRFLDFSDPGEQVTAAAFLGLLSSGSSVAFPLLLFPSNLKNTKQLLRNRMILSPLDKRGNLLKGSSLKRWELAESAKAIGNYPAQGGGMAGAGLSMAVGPAYALFGNAPAAAQNTMISLIGSAETITTGFSIGGRTSYGYRSARKSLDKGLNQQLRQLPPLPLSITQ